MPHRRIAWTHAATARFGPQSLDYFTGPIDGQSDLFTGLPRFLQLIGNRAIASQTTPISKICSHLRDDRPDLRKVEDDRIQILSVDLGHITFDQGPVWEL